MHEADVGLRERKKQRTRELIAKTALELFSEYGYQATTVADIAASAELSERTIFGYFPTKEDILFADHLALEQGLAEVLGEKPAGRKIARLRMRTFGIPCVSFSRRHVRWRPDIAFSPLSRGRGFP